jgi:MoaA/NifB/PqqE/SkfB family radical SAM enzyme
MIEYKERKPIIRILQEDHRVYETCLAYLKGNIPSLSLGISGICNMGCLYCDREAGTKKTDELTSSQRVSVFEKIAPYGIQVVDFCFEGEPLLDLAFWSIIEIAHDRGILPFTFSNLTQIDSMDKAEILLRNNVTIAGKMDRVDNFDDLLNREGASIKIKRGLDFLLKAGYPNVKTRDGQDYTKMSMVFVPTALNYMNIGSVAEECKQNKFFLRVGELELIGRGYENRKRLALERKKLDWVYSQISKVFGYNYLQTYQECCFNVLGLMIGVDGKVFVDQYGLSCPFIFPKDMGELQVLYMGDALKDPIDEIWNKIEHLRIKNIHLLESRIAIVLKAGKSLGCSGKSDVILNRALSLIKQKHNLP